MNAILICVFNKEKYLELAYLLLESIQLFGLRPTAGVDKSSIDVIVYTSTEFRDKIIEKFGEIEWMIFELNDGYDSIDKACKARLDVFDFAISSKYEKFLYFDTDVIVKGKLNKIFDMCVDEVVYATQEGHIKDDVCSRECFGVGLMSGAELEKWKDRSVFTTGVMVFKNCEVIRELFGRIKADIVERPVFTKCYDQPYIIYHCLLGDLYDNQLLNKYVVNRNSEFRTAHLVHHFPEVTGEVGERWSWMYLFLENYKEYVKKMS